MTGPPGPGRRDVPVQGIAAERLTGRGRAPPPAAPPRPLLRRAGPGYTRKRPSHAREVAMPSQTDFNDRMLSLGLARVSEAAAIASARHIGRGDEKAADQAAVDAMRRQLNLLDIDGVVVIGEGERDEAPMLFIGEHVGTGTGPAVDIALDPLEGTTLTAKDMPNALSVIAMAPRGTLLHAPDVYMEKLAVGPGYAEGVVTLDMPAGERVRQLARAKGGTAADITVCILERPRHAELVRAVRETGAAIRLITDGDVAGVIHCAEAATTGIDMYMGSGGAPEGVLAAAALKCMGGQIMGQLLFRNDEERDRAARAGIADLARIYSRDEMVQADVIFAATGVTDGSILRGIRREVGWLTTETVLMRSKTGSVRRMTYRTPVK
jgi:fructose-1,6-bisphosphatase II / sedoheptulose-1,7-bisphosphatase